MAPELFVWDVVTGSGSAQEAIARVADAIEEIPDGLDVWGHVTRVRLQLITLTRGSTYQRLGRVALVRRHRDGSVCWAVHTDPVGFGPDLDGEPAPAPLDGGADRGRATLGT